MFGGLMFLLYGNFILTFFAGLAGILGNDTVRVLTDPDHSKIIQHFDYMFPENFLSKYPHESDAFRMKIVAYVIFNLLVTFYNNKGPGRYWGDYNRNDFKRVLMDAAFYEYFTNFTDREAKNFFNNPLKRAKRNPQDTSEEITVHRIGQYLDQLSETESQQKRLKGIYDILSDRNASPTITKPRRVECRMQTLTQTSGVPGIDYPNFCDIPETSFSCADKMVPGIYADYETGCQVFHVCWPHRMDSFLCPIGTIFNQSRLTCDIWHNTGCYSAPMFFNRNQFLIDGRSTETDIPEYDGSCNSILNKPLLLHLKFLPAKCEIKQLEDGKLVNTKSHEKDEFRMRLETAYGLVREMLDMLREIRNDLADEIIDSGTPRFHEHGKRTIPKFHTETANKAVEFTRKVGESRFRPTNLANKVNHSGKPLSGSKRIRIVTSSAVLMPSKSLKAHIKSSRDGDMPEIVKRSLRLGGTILNEGIIPSTKRMIDDSYQRIKSIKY